MFKAELEERGYQVTFAPLTLRSRLPEASYQEGVMLATKEPHEAVIHHYYDIGNELTFFDKARYRETMRKAVIYATVANFHIATTHFTWTLHGAEASAYQREDMEALMTYLDQQQPHILTADLNIPRYHNPLYDEYLVPRYRDAVPEQYRSSLDRTHHRYAHDANLQHLFTDFMVDHLLVPPSIQTSDVVLTFGLSDHAGIAADMSLR